MNTDEITQALRGIATYDCGFETESDIVTEAALVIESQQAEIDNLKSAQVTHYCANCEAMARKLAEAERRGPVAGEGEKG